MPIETRHQPNLIFVFADQMRSTALGCAGVEPVQTPVLDRFAQQGTRFANAVSNTPVCCPARASLLTGLHTLSHRVVWNDTPLRTDVPGIAHSLNAAGYRCGYIGKWHLDQADRGIFVPPGPRRQGFDDYWAASNCNHSYFRAFYYLNDSPEPRWFDCYEPEGQTALADQYIRSRAQQSDPFCLFVSWGPPHCPYDEVPQRYLDRYPPEKIELLPNVPDNADRSVFSGYYAHVTALDECFGRILRAVEESGISGNSIVIFSSDHGDMLFSHNRGWKGKPWRESVGIPLLVRWPNRVAAGRTTHGPISIVDLMPTLLSMAGVPIPPGVDGEDRASFVCGDELAAADSVFIDYPVSPVAYSYGAWRGVVTRTHTYARFREAPWILYDDAVDPFQLQNLAGDQSCAELEEAMERRLTYWLDRTNDPFDPAQEVADRYYHGHVDRMIPFFYNPQIKAGLEARAARRY